VWVTALREYVAGDAPEDVRTGYERRQPPPHPQAGDRVDFTAAYSYEDFADLTRCAVLLAVTVDEPYARLLRMLATCYPVSESDLTGYRAQHQGASYKQLAYIAHLSGMDARQRREWYRLCESIPLSQRHAGHLISELQGRAP
jgi:hypothetical protein